MTATPKNKLCTGGHAFPELGIHVGIRNEFCRIKGPEEPVSLYHLSFKGVSKGARVVPDTEK